MKTVHYLKMIFFVQLLIMSCFAFGSIYNLNIDIIYPPDVTGERVVGGTNATDGVAPFQCSLQLVTPKKHFCGCSIVSDKWILTAAHCLSAKQPSAIHVLVGTNDLQNGGEFYKAERFVLHESYNNPYYAYDIALIEVKGSIVFNDKVQPIEISSEEVPAGADLQLTGWGRLSFPGELSQWLQIIKLNSIGRDSCRNARGIGRHIHESHLCTFTKHGEGACSGDSGGPLVRNNTVVGVVNFGFPCAKGLPDAYANVAYFHDWIKNYTS